MFIAANARLPTPQRTLTLCMDGKENGSYRCHQSCKALAAEQWFGYGRWAAPYWFAGMEPGGQDDARVYETWHELGAPEIKGGVGQLFGHAACTVLPVSREYAA
jgi:hypothetical protein